MRREKKRKLASGDTSYDDKIKETKKQTSITSTEGGCGENAFGKWKPTKRRQQKKKTLHDCFGNLSAEKSTRPYHLAENQASLYQ
jgi:hypothetical protein